MLDADKVNFYLADEPPTVVQLKIKPHFEALSEQEKLYAHYISVASLAGTRIVLRQVSPESEAIYDFIISLHLRSGGNWTSLQQKANLTDEELGQFLNYGAQFLANSGNYKGFGDTKFIPRLPADRLKALATAVPEALELYQKIEKDLYAGDSKERLHLGYPDEGHVSNYYPDSPSITKDEITEISGFLEDKRILPENTRLRKTARGDFELLVASASENPNETQRDTKETQWTLSGKLKGKSLTVVYGDYTHELQKVADALENASKHAGNETQRSMLQEYAKSFRSGSLLAFKNSQRYWIKDKSPSVECNIGFIETYRDPHGVRAEWEGFVAMVNKERTEAFTELVKAAPGIIPRLPWDREFEKDKFLSPDFTSLEVLTFAGSGIPAGINIPNYDDIRQTEGFKNVSLGNVLTAKGKDERVPFIKKDDLDTYKRYQDAAFEVQVGLHELLGHGCGKLLQETSPGTYNFDFQNRPVNPLSGKPIDSWYKPGQTWGSVFGGLAPTMEECRAECVAMYLSCDFDILKLFGFGDGSEDIDGEAGDVLYATYLSMARAGLAALEYWDPKTRKWGQAHMQARFSILRTFLSAGVEFASLDYEEKDASDVTVKINRSKILTHGRVAVKKYLLQLHILKATADYEEAKLVYEDITDVDDWFESTLRPAVLAKKVPRKIFVQANTQLNGNSVVLKEYSATAEGMIMSYADRNYI